MIPPPASDRRPPITPQLALRVAIIGGVAVAVFAVFFFRLWYLQVLSGSDYRAQARSNRVRQVRIPAPRGEVLGRNGHTLVTSRQGLSVQVQTPKLPKDPARRTALYRRLAHVLGYSTKPKKCGLGPDGDQIHHLPRLQCTVAQQEAAVPYANATVSNAVPRNVYTYLLTHQREFPAVTVQPVHLRAYPHHELAAQVFGYVGQINADELKQAHYKGVPQGTVVGQTGLEYTYDRYLRGKPGADKIEVNALGQTKRYLPEREPKQGKNLLTSLDLGVLKAGHRALEEGMQLGGPAADAAAYVAMNPRNGQLIGMGSLPSYDPKVFTQPISPKRYHQLFLSPQADHPQENRAISGTYPTGSTFKLVTATAGLQSGVITPDSGFVDTGQADICGAPKHNAGSEVLGALNVTSAIRYSSDLFFYNVGCHTNNPRPAGGPLQKWAKLYGFGRPTGIDLPGETAGNVPSPRWRARVDRQERHCEHVKHVSSCGISDGRPWSAGDNMNLAVGQGDLEADPLQLATAYAAMANGGKVVTPHIGLSVQSHTGRVLQEIDPKPARHVDISASTRTAILTGLHEAATAPGGTSTDVWAGWPKDAELYGKTGTAQHYDAPDQSWYVCFIKDRAHPLVIAVTVENGGFGASAAAPAAKIIASQYYGVKTGSVQPGSSRSF
jgi:penicillin-binding protein 2